MNKSQLFALIGSAAAVISVAFFVVTAPAASAPALTTTTTVESQSTTLSVPKAPAKPTTTTKAPARRLRLVAHVISTSTTQAPPAGLTATTTPGMPAEPTDEQSRIPGPCADEDACEHMPWGEDYDLPMDTDTTLEHESPLGPPPA